MSTSSKSSKKRSRAAISDNISSPAKSANVPIAKPESRSHSSSASSSSKSTPPSSSLFHEVECELKLALPPRRLGEIKDGICEQLNAKLFTYNQQLNGVIVAYRSIQYRSKLGQIFFERPYIHFTISVVFLIVKIKANAIIQTRVNSVTPDHISLLYCGVFQASLHADRLSNYFEFISHPLYGDMFIDKRHTPSHIWQKLTNDKKAAKLAEKEARRKAYEESQHLLGNVVSASHNTKKDDLQWLNYAIRNQTLLQVKVLSIATNNNFFTFTADCLANNTGVIDNEAIEPSMFALTVDQERVNHTS